MYEYKAIPAPTKPLKRKGVKTVEDRFAVTISETMNSAASEGWEYVRADTLPCEERSGLTSKTTRFQTLLVFRRPLHPVTHRAESNTDTPLQLLPAPEEAATEQASAPVPAPTPDPPAPTPTATSAPKPAASPLVAIPDPVAPAPASPPVAAPRSEEPTPPKRVPTFADARIEQRRVDRIAPETLTVLNSMKGARPNSNEEDDTPFSDDR
ncbi:MAG: DUF4177 domain-containing protein [Pseudomonadota bacterium]